SCGPGSSSSNGRSKRSLIGQIDELIETVTETLDVHGTPGFLVRFDDDGVQARVAGRGFELRRQRAEEAAGRRVEVAANDRVGRPSVRYAVPLGRMRSSAVCTCVCVPMTAVTLPSRCQPIATFSDVASA